MKNTEVYELASRKEIFKHAVGSFLFSALVMSFGIFPVVDKAGVLSLPGESHFHFYFMGLEVQDDTSQWFVAVSLAVVFVGIGVYIAGGAVHRIVTNPRVIRVHGDGTVEFEMPFSRKTVIEARSIETVYLLQEALRVKHTNGTANVDLSMTDLAVGEEDVVRILTSLNPAIRLARGDEYRKPSIIAQTFDFLLEWWSLAYPAAIVSAVLIVVYLIFLSPKLDNEVVESLECLGMLALVALLQLVALRYAWVRSWQTKKPQE